MFGNSFGSLLLVLVITAFSSMSTRVFNPHRVTCMVSDTQSTEDYLTQAEETIQTLRTELENKSELVEELKEKNQKLENQVKNELEHSDSLHDRLDLYRLALTREKHDCRRLKENIRSSKDIERKVRRSLEAFKIQEVQRAQKVHESESKTNEELSQLRSELAQYKADNEELSQLKSELAQYKAENESLKQCNQTTD